MSKNLGNITLIASTATFTLLIFQALAIVPPSQKTLPRNQTEQLAIPQANTPHHATEHLGNAQVQVSNY
jgi:hypothetical protein